MVPNMATNYAVLLLVILYFASIRATVLEARLPCIPTSIVRGPCHDCMCTEKGIYHCQAVKCRDINANDKELLDIHDGEKCVPGKVYQQDCNTCHCTKSHSLVCTKMACISKAVMHKVKVKTSLQDYPRDCIPGKFYKKGCRKCFCQENGKAFCSKINNCEDIFTPPSSPAALRSFRDEEFNELPSLPHQAAACTAGTTYRVDCNTCFCLASGNLACERLLCPSFDDVNRLNAKNMSGGNCTKGDKLDAPCIHCICKNNAFKCANEPGCVAPEMRRRLHGDYPSSASGDRFHFDPQKEKCMDGMVYRTDCNKCYCQKDQTARCTQRTCLNYSQVNRMKKLRVELERNGI